MSGFRDLDEFLDDSLRLPIGGTTYVVPPVDAKTGIIFERLLAAGVTVANGGELEGDLSPILDDDQELTLYERALGTAYQQMIDDGVSWPRIKLAGVTSFLFTTAGAEVAEAYWSSGGASQGEAVAPNRAARRAQTRSSSTGGASTTRERVSGSGTKSRRSSSPK